MTYQSYHGSDTEELNILISKAKPKYSLRSSLNIEVPRPRSEIGRSSYKHRAALAWNLLPHHVKDCADLRSFNGLGLMRTNIYRIAYIFPEVPAVFQ